MMPDLDPFLFSRRNLLLFLWASNRMLNRLPLSLVPDRFSGWVLDEQGRAYEPLSLRAVIYARCCQSGVKSASPGFAGWL